MRDCILSFSLLTSYCILLKHSISPFHNPDQSFVLLFTLSPVLHSFSTQSEQNLLCHIQRTFNHLPFCRRWLDRADGGSTAINGQHGRQSQCAPTLYKLVKKGIVEEYPPLVDSVGSYSSQLEHTFLIK